MWISTFFLQATITSLLLTMSVRDGQVQSQTSQPEPSGSRTAISPEARKQVRKAIPAIGLVMVRDVTDKDSKPRARGSAVIIEKEGLVVTNFHVIARDQSTRLFDELYISLPANPDNDASTLTRQMKLQPAMTNQERDLALLKIVSEANAKADVAPLTLPFIELGDSSKIELLDDLFIVGFPEKGGTTITVNYGVVEGKDAPNDWIKTDARIIHGNSGGAALNAQGQLIGIPTQIVTDSDGKKIYGSVGYLRTSNLVATMKAKYHEMEKTNQPKILPNPPPTTEIKTTPAPNAPNTLLTVSGTVKSSDGKLLTGVRVGLLIMDKVIAWGGTNSEGRFVLEKPVPPGRYNLRAKEIGYELYNIDIDLSAATTELKIILKSF